MSLYQQAAALAPVDQLAWAGQWRQRAIDALQSVSLPSVRDEDWKYTTLRSLERAQLATAPGQASNAALSLPEGFAGRRLVFVDGHYDASLSDTSAIDGLSVTALSAMDADPRFDAWFSALPESDAESLATLNTAMMTDGVVVRVSDVVTAPVAVVFLSNGSAERALPSSFVRNIIEADAGAKLAIAEFHASATKGKSLCHSWTQLRVGQGATLELSRMYAHGEDAQLVTRLDGELAQASTLRLHNLDVGGKLTRHDINVQFKGEGAGLLIGGAYVADGRSHVDQHHRVDHLVPDCTSHDVFRGVVAGKGRAVFNAKAIVHAGADGTEAHQNNANLMLSRDSEVDTKPELQIHADDVKCSHGATIGQLDETAMFYLRTRGIAEADARVLLTEGFCSEALQTITDERTRAWFTQALAAKLRGQTS